MFQGISASFNPIGPWPLLLPASAAVVVLTVWAYARKLRGPGARWRWVALSLRLLAVLLCLLAALRPSVIVQEKKKQAASVVFMLDDSTSMLLADGVSGRTRWEDANETLESAVEAVKKLDPDLEVKTLRFATTLVEPKPDEAKPPEPVGRETQLGTAMVEAEKRQAESNRRAARMIILSDFASNNGGWGFAASVGVDPQPYFRIFNPLLQSEKFDPDGGYVRQWVPELARLSAGLIHKPWTASAEILARAGVVLGDTYPEPIIDHKAGRERALTAWRHT
jgi:hypothetical protein